MNRHGVHKRCVVVMCDCIVQWHREEAGSRKLMQMGVLCRMACLRNEQLGALLWNVRHLQHIGSVLGNVQLGRRTALNVFHLALHLQQCIARWGNCFLDLWLSSLVYTPLLDSTGKFVAACRGWVVWLKSILNVMLSMITTTRNWC